MKKALEVVLVLSVVGLGAYLVQQARARRELSARAAMANAASAPGLDAENPDAPPAGFARVVTSVPMIKSARPSKTSRLAPALPPPPVAP